MLTLKRFKALTDSYGADPRRWPEAVRGDAEVLLRLSPEARRMLASARELDEAINATSDPEDTLPPSEEKAAMLRLRAGVAARLAEAASHEAVGREVAPPAPMRSTARRGNIAARRRLGWLRSGMSPFTQWPTFVRVAGMAAAGGLIVAAGLLLGSMDATGPTAQVDVLAMLQPSPLPFLADQ